jgi:DeoR/GlpR family transcriptional regulator of sugar metabolism
VQPNLLASQRHDYILECIRRDGSVRVRALADRLGVSDMTVRRDLDQLAGLGLVDKVHGGATRTGGRSTNEPGFEIKQRQQESEKQLITSEAASMIEPGAAIGLTAGTTTWTLAKKLLDIPGLTIVTNAPSVARVFHRSTARDVSVVLTGGVRTPSDALVGPIATQSLRGLHVDIIFMGVHGVDPELGFSTPNLAEAEVNRAFVDAARQVVVLADHTKWGIRGLAQIVPLDRADVLISDDQLPSAALSKMEQVGCEVRLASPR